MKRTGRGRCVLGVIALCCGACVDAPDEPTGQREQALVLPSELIETTTITLANGDVADVYAPAVPGRMRRAFADRFPVVVYLQGAFVARGYYRGFGHELARHGLVVVIPDHLRAFGPPGSPPVPVTEANVIGATADTLAILDADPASSLYRIVDTSKIGVGGHSLGGVVALSALAGGCAPPFCTPPFTLPAGVGALALYGTHNVQGTEVIDLDTHGIGVALLRGDLDGRASPANVEATYGVLDDERALITLHGANHFALCDDGAPAGAVPDPNPQELDQDDSVRAVATWTGRWFRDQLIHDPVADVWLRVLAGSLDGTVEVETE